MAFNANRQVIRTYGRHKKRTITAWISPETNVKAHRANVFSSPDCYDLTSDSPPATVSINSSSSNHSDEEWFPGKKAGRQAKKPLKERNVIPAQLDKKPAPRKAPNRKAVRGKENPTERSVTTVDDLHQPVRETKASKLSRRRGRGDAKDTGLKGDKQTTAVNNGDRNGKNRLVRCDLIHSPIQRSLDSSSKRGRTDSSDITFDASCDLFGYSADVSDRGSCSLDDKAESWSRPKPSPEDNCVFASPAAFLPPGLNINRDCIETSTPNEPRNCLSKPPNVPQRLHLHLQVSGKRVTRSSSQDVGKLNGAVPEFPIDAVSPVSTADAVVGVANDRASCRRLTCQSQPLKSTNLSDITNEISLLDLNNTHDGHSKAKSSENVDSRAKFISPCSVVVTPIPGDCLSQYSSSSVLACQTDKVHLLESEDENKDEDVGSKQIKTESLIVPNCSKLSNSYHPSFKDALTPVKSKTTGRFVTAQQKVMVQCNQVTPVPFDEAIPPAMMAACSKIGEGVYGEVFRTVSATNQSVALKVIPIEGDFQVNGEPQKSFEEILPEIVISRELSSLKDGSVSTTGGFIKVNRVSCCQGSYPKKLLDQWDEYGNRKESENDRPDVFPDDQLFILFEFADGGDDLESKRLESVRQAVSIFQQVAISLAVAEQSLEFEHRDLHWGNVLVLPTSERTVSFLLEGEEIQVASHGVQASMIDFTLSRLKQDDCTVYCDLANDETLFTGRGDPQFGVYRKMRCENDNDWEPWNPHTNVLWLHYLLDKLLKAKTYPRTKQDPAPLKRKLRTLSRHLLEHSSALEVVRDAGLLEI